MSQRISIWLVACTVTASSWSSISLAQESTPATSASSTLRVLTYNIHHGRGTDQQVDLLRIAGVIRAQKPDLVALQEVDQKTRRTSGVDQTAALAKLTGLHGEFLHQIDFEGGRYGQAVLSRFPLSDATVHWLPGTPDRERRIAGSVSVRLDDTRTLRFVTTHLHHNNADFREQQAVELNRLFVGCLSQTITILAGVLNAVPNSPPLQQLNQHWTSVTAPDRDVASRHIKAAAQA
jgi:endonuclease/exonuclease/phosphatase family metal-dependent hydrolase